MLVILSGCVGRRIHLSKMTPRTLFSLKLTNSPSPSPTLPQQHVLELLMENFNIAEPSLCTGRVPFRKTFEKKNFNFGTCIWGLEEQLFGWTQFSSINLFRYLQLNKELLFNTSRWKVRLHSRFYIHMTWQTYWQM